ncbi:GPI mannosyltransferase 4 [Neolecta irregularis DAH-3]|uniref:Mannosyltransferase n=1 Tax=Neolecta irregularis (strain DAH-3) TaxID=1198029 RepID=A0A1U7LGA9_NEOID|nr:GPI mannosyltransferase 4 [Neolecta irregularis DAH-3]|eukprot:OLL21633.1 GPI mannosyltransferase 4 [Neolecta irregularis DAH-3]
MFFLTKKRALYGLLVLFRLYFAFQPSYIHPDEHFQGPEVLAGISGDLFKWETIKTWDFSSDKPIRGILPLWIFYAIPLLSTHLSRAYLNPTSIFYALRAAFFVYSFVIGLTCPTEKFNIV